MSQYSRFGTFNAVLPKAGPKTYPFNLDFSSMAQQVIDMTNEITNGNIDYISGVYFDNRKNANPLEITAAGSNHSVGIPAGKQGFMPMMTTDSATLTFTTVVTPGGLIIPVQIVNFPVWPIVF